MTFQTPGGIGQLRPQAGVSPWAGSGSGWNPQGIEGITLSNNNRTAAIANIASGSWGSATTSTFTTSQWKYFECQLVFTEPMIDYDYNALGVWNYSTGILGGPTYLGWDGNSVGLFIQGGMYGVWANGTGYPLLNSPVPTTGDVIGVAVNPVDGIVTYYVNSFTLLNLQSSQYFTINGGTTYYIGSHINATTVRWTLRTAAPFAYPSIAASYIAWE